jgi:hypothetical protein
MTDFPDVDPSAISTLAGSLKSISTSMAGIGLETEGVRGSVMGSEQWKGTASERWYTVVTGRVGDAGLTNDVIGSVATLLDGLAQDLESEQRLYQRMSDNLYTAKPQQGVISRLEGPEMVVNPDVQKSMSTCAERAVQLLDAAAGKLIAYAGLAEDLHSSPAADRMPGVLAGTSQQAASLHLLAMLFGSVVGDNHDAGTEWEDIILQELGIAKNSTVWRPNPPFEGKMTKSGNLARGVTPDGWGKNFVLEIKGTVNVNTRFQIRGEALLARLTKSEFWIIKQGTTKVDPKVTQLAEDAKGGVLYTTDNGKTYTDAHGNPVKVTYDKASNTLKVTGYHSSTAAAGAGGGSDANAGESPDPDAPSQPVSPEIAQGGAGTSADPEPPVAPEDPGDPVGPVDPEIVP